MSNQKSNNNEGADKQEMRLKIIDLVVKFLSFGLTVMVLWIGVYQYKENNEKNLRNEIYKLRYDTYLELINVTSHLANIDKDSTSTKRFQEKCDSFFRLHTGKLNMTLDSALNESVFKFRNHMLFFKIRTSDVTNSDLQADAQEIALICNKLLQETWNIDIDELLTHNDK